MKVFHTSPNKIEKITKSGLFDDCLFFSADEYAMGMVKAVYSLELDESKIINVSALYDIEIIEHISSALDLDNESAERLLDGRDTAFDHGKDGEDDWWLQAKQGECAKAMGFEAVEATDEQGTVYIVPMFGRESDLVLEKII